MHTGLSLVAAATAILGVVLFGARHLVSGLLYGDVAWGDLVVAMAIGSSLNVMVTIQLGYLRNSGRVGPFAGCTVALLLAESGLAVAMVAAGTGVWGLVAAPLVARAVFALAGWAWLARELPPALDAGIARDLVRVGAPLIPRSSLGLVDNGIDRVLVGWLSSVGHVGLLSMANRVGYSTFSLSTSIENIYMPQVYRQMFAGGPQAGAEIGRYLSPYIYLSLVPATIVVLFVQEILWMLTTPSFYGVAVPAAILTVYYGQMFFGKIVGAQFVYLKQTWYLVGLSVVRVVAHLAFVLVLVPVAGAVGAAAALLATGIVTDATGFVLAQRRYPIAYEGRVGGAMLLILYGALGWVVFATVSEVGYAIVLAGKGLLVLASLACGLRWRRQAAETLSAALTRIFSPAVAVREPRPKRL
jgi:O-antigen/teichoic acid export membrane protein